MGNIHVKNQFGALCPETAGREHADADDGRRQRAKDMNPGCNVLRKSFLNKVGCPVDVYFAPRSKGAGGYDCEMFEMHLGPHAPAGRARDPDLDGRTSPLKFTNTYNGHAFHVRMSHDQSLVARIELDHDVIGDCPEPGRSGASAGVRASERLPRGAPVDTAMDANATLSPVYAFGAWANATAAPIQPGKPPREKRHVPWQNHTAYMSASVPIVS